MELDGQEAELTFIDHPANEMSVSNHVIPSFYNSANEMSVSECILNKKHLIVLNPLCSTSA